ncbi:MAG: cell division/cell wall cluster transcriptional repressor MraZ [Clostridia bacterium]|nr:cell division/cell wall cluster transcriptional repressor MraZ [Clostridia bacterium]
MSAKNYVHQLDAKNRMRIPAKLREELGQNYSVTVGSGGCLVVYSQSQMAELKSTLKNINPYKENQVKAARFILYNTFEPEEDKQGRILLPENLRKYAKIQKNVIVFKGPSSVEIWAEEVWNDYFNDVNFNDLASAWEELKNNG